MALSGKGKKLQTEDELGVDSVSIEVSLLLAELSHWADRWGNLNGEIHKYTNTLEQIFKQTEINT